MCPFTFYTLNKKCSRWEILKCCSLRRFEIKHCLLETHYHQMHVVCYEQIQHRVIVLDNLGGPEEVKWSSYTLKVGKLTNLKKNDRSSVCISYNHLMTPQIPFSAWGGSDPRESDRTSGRLRLIWRSQTKSATVTGRGSLRRRAGAPGDLGNNCSLSFSYITNESWVTKLLRQVKRMTLKQSWNCVYFGR